MVRAAAATPGYRLLTLNAGVRYRGIAGLYDEAHGSNTLSNFELLLFLSAFYVEFPCFLIVAIASGIGFYYPCRRLLTGWDGAALWSLPLTLSSVLATYIDIEGSWACMSTHFVNLQ